METTQSGLTSLNNCGNWQTIAYSFQCFIPEVQRQADCQRRGTVRLWRRTLYFVHSCGLWVLANESGTTLGTRMNLGGGKLLETWLPLALVQK
jgi:hypothetical protein